MTIKHPPKGEISNISNTWGSLSRTNLSSLFFNMDSQGGKYGTNISHMVSYRRMLHDAQIKSRLEERVKALLANALIVEAGADDRKSKKAADALRENVNGLDFDEIASQMLYCIFFGWGIAEIIWTPIDGIYAIEDIKVRQQERFRFDHEGKIYLYDNFKPMLMPDRKFWKVVYGATNADELYGNGLCVPLYWLHMLKSKGYTFWASFLERFGSPTATMTVDMDTFKDERRLEQARSALRCVAQEGNIVIPQGYEINLLQAAAGAGGDYNVFIDIINDDIAKLIVGQTMTSKDGSSRSQSEVHKHVRDEILDADSDLLYGAFNKQVAKWFTQYNYPGAVPPKLSRVTTEKEDLRKIAETDKILYEMGYKPSPKRIQMIYGEDYIEVSPQKETREEIDITPIVQTMGIPNKDTKTIEEEEEEEDNAKPFAENTLLERKKLKHIQNMDILEEQAQKESKNYQEILGSRVEEILQIAQSVNDFGVFQQRLSELASQDPSVKTVEEIQKSRIVSRLLGAFSSKR